MKTKDLLEIAYQVQTLNVKNEAAITGSLMFLIEGKRLGRKPNDIDIIVSSLSANKDSDDFPVVPEGFKYVDWDGFSGSEVDTVKFINDDGVKLDFLFSEEDRKMVNYKGVNYFVGEMQLAISAKEYYVKHDSRVSSIKKHEKDLIMLKKKPFLSIGTRSVLFGAHCFLIHPLFVAIAWIKLFGFPFDPRIWLAFFVHDLGYIGKPNMDGPEGETHVELGAKIMHIFDGWKFEMCIMPLFGEDQQCQNLIDEGWRISHVKGNSVYFGRISRKSKWLNFSLYHSRYYAKKNGANLSRLCYADKLSFALTPRWIYLPMVNLTGEIKEYLAKASSSNEVDFSKSKGQIEWHKELSRYLIDWVEAHKDGQKDTWTKVSEK